ncbi:MAG: extracellular solute-binding protein [Spirochaetales bacterium]|nr:extracellular solute-binding protein [Spirochaetales bacterium]
MKKMLLVLVALSLSLPLWANGDGENAGDEERMQISFGYWQEELFGGAFDRENDLMIQAFEDKFGVEMVPKFVTWSDFNEKYKLWAAAGELPDFFATDLDKRTYMDWIDQGVLRALPEDLSAYPEVEKTLTRSDTAHLAIDGRYYRIPRLHSVYPHVATGMYVRKDWMENMGIEDPKDWDSFIAMVDRFVNDDPDGNGLDDTIGVLPRRSGYWSYLRHSFTPALWATNWVEEGGRWIPAFYSEKTTEAVEAVGKMYADGLLYKDFLLLKDFNVADEKFSFGNVGVILSQGDPPRAQQTKDAWDKANPDKPFNEYVKLLTTFPFESSDGQRYNINRPGYWANNYFRGDLSDEKMAKILEMLNFLSTEDGVDFWYRGFEGKEYTQDGDTYVDTRPMGEDGEKMSIADLYPSSLFFGGMAYWGNDKVFFNEDEINYSRYDRDVVAMTREFGLIQDNDCISYPTDMLISEMGNEYLASQGVSVNPREIMEAALITENPREAWEQSLEKFRRDGLEEHIAKVNEMIAEKDL